jgi:Domain of unknown function (DUF4402)
MNVLRHLALPLAGLAAAVAIPSPSDAQCRLCDQPSIDRPQDAPEGDVQLQIETNLNFDRLILVGAGAGAATIRPDGSTAAEGAIGELGPRAMVGTVLVHGDPGRAVRVELPRRIDLYSLGGGRMTLEDVETDLSGAPRLDAAGNLSFRFGGRLIVSGDADGQFRGDLPITVEYQ